MKIFKTENGNYVNFKDVPYTIQKRMMKAILTNHHLDRKPLVLSGCNIQAIKLA